MSITRIIRKNSVNFVMKIVEAASVLLHKNVFCAKMNLSYFNRIHAFPVVRSVSAVMGMLTSVLIVRKISLGILPNKNASIIVKSVFILKIGSVRFVRQIAKNA
jgi:hypothetical protein